MSTNELTWADPQLWWLLLSAVLILVLVALHFRLRAAIVRRLGEVPLIRRMTASTSVARQWVKWVLVITATLLVATGALRPQYGTREAELKNRGIDIAVVIDLSKSMMVQDVAPNRLRAAATEVKKVLEKLPGGRVALVPFAGTAFTQCALTTDLSAISLYLDELRVEDMPVGGTRIGNAIRHALTLFDTKLSDEDQKDEDLEGLEQIEPSHYKAIILITDGEDHDADAIAAAQLADSRNVRIYSVGIGSQNSGAPIPQISEEGQRVGWVSGDKGQKIFSDLNVALLKDLADTTGGLSVVYGQDDVAGAITASLDTLEKQEYERQFQDLREDRFQFVLIPAFVLLVVEALITDRRRRKVAAGGVA